MKIIAHRGASSLAPENTMPAFHEGWRCGSDGVEMDLHLTANGKIAVIHDQDTSRIGNVSLMVANSTMSDLKRVDAGIWKGEKWRTTAIPELSEVLDAAPVGRELVLELKVGAEILPVLKEYIDGSNVPEEDLVLISFNDSVFSAKEYLPDSKCYFLESDPKKLDASFAKSAEAGIDGLDLYWELVNSATTEAAKSAGLDVYVWTVDNVGVARKMRDFGVSALTTNTPAEIISLIGKAM